MTVFNLSLAKHTAESMGFDNLPDDVLTALTQDMDYRLRELIQEAKKFMRHSHRSFLTSQDIHSTLALKNIEPIYGYHTIRPIRFKKTQDRVFYLDDSELDFDKVLSTPLPRLPVDASISAHWLAIDGIQPLIPQNPPPGDRRSLINTSSSTTTTATTTTNNNNNEKINNNRRSGQSSSSSSLVKDTLSREFQLYYEKITEAICSNNSNIITAALESIHTDTGLQALVPYFINFCQDRLSCSLRERKGVSYIITFLEYLLGNPHIFIEPYLHQIVPLLLTIILSKRHNTNVLLEECLASRDQAGALLSDIVLKYSNSYPSLMARITKTLLVAIVDDTKPMTTKYGAIVGLSLLGPDVITATLIPYAEHYSVTIFEPTLGNNNDNMDISNNSTESQQQQQQQPIIPYLLEAFASSIASCVMDRSPQSISEAETHLNQIGWNKFGSILKHAIQLKLDKAFGKMNHRHNQNDKLIYSTVDQV